MHKTIIQQLIRGMVIAGVMAGGMMAADAGAEVGAGAGTGAGALIVFDGIEVDEEDVGDLYQAVFDDNIDDFKALLDDKSLAERTALVYSEIMWGVAVTVLWLVVYKNRVQFLELLIEYGIDVNRPFRRERPIHVAAREGRLEILQLLHDRGADLNVCDSDGQVPLQLATFSSLRVDVVEFLLQNGASFALAFLSEAGINSCAKLRKSYNIRLANAAISNNFRRYHQMVQSFDVIKKALMQHERWSALRRAWCGAVARGVCARRARQVATGEPEGQAPAAGRAKRPRGQRYVPTPGE